MYLGDTFVYARGPGCAGVEQRSAASSDGRIYGGRVVEVRPIEQDGHPDGEFRDAHQHGVHDPAPDHRRAPEVEERLMNWARGLAYCL